MKIVNYGESDFEEIILLLGYFDCIHIGHRKLIKKAINLKDVKDCKIALFTFKNDNFSKDGALLLFDERIAKAERLGVDEIVVADFNENFKNTSCEDFIRELHRTLNISAVVCGFDYRFGKNAAGNAQTLTRICEKMNTPCFVVPKTEANGEKISSTLIKSLLRQGKIKEANTLLGEEYSLTGQVVHGREVGRTIGFPTANVNVPANKFRIKNGVYKTRVLIDGKVYDAITNYGARPTFNLGEVLTESFIKNFDGDIYGKIITVFFVDFIRDIEKFYDADKLKEQLEKDKKYD